MRACFLIATAAALALVPRPALALRPEVEEAVTLYNELRFDEAREAFERAVRLEGNRADDLASIHLHLGLLDGAEDREDQAEEHFRVALAVDPMVELPPGQPPKITRPFGRARDFWGGSRLRIEHSPPDDWHVGAPADLRFEAADDQLGLVTAARLRIWRDDAEGDRSYRQDGGGPFVFPVPPELLESEGVVRYRVELLGPAASILLVLDGDDLAAEVAPRPPEPEPGERVVYVPGEGPRPPRIYEQWWFWTVIVGVVAGAATAVALPFVIPGEGVDMSRPQLVD